MLLDKYMTRKEIAEYLGVNVATINKWLKIGMPYIQLASNRKLYDKEEVEKWLLGKNK